MQLVKVVLTGVFNGARKGAVGNGVVEMGESAKNSESGVRSERREP